METRTTAVWKSAPALAPALGLLAGVWLATRLDLDVRPLVALAGLSLAARPGRARAVGWVAAGVLCARLGWLDREAARPRLDPSRPVEAVVRIVEHPRRGAFGWLAAGVLERARQGRAVDGEARAVLIDLPPGAPPAIGSRLRARGYLARSAGYANRLGVAPGPWRLRVKHPALVAEEARPRWPWRLSARLRGRVEQALAVGGGGPGRAFARALVLGDGGSLEPCWRRAMRRSGLAHLLAVSGFNVSLAAAACLLLGGWLPRRLRFVPAALAVVLYLLLVGPLAPILRAAAMGVLALGALWLRRPPQAANALALTVAILIAARPAWIADVGFQLTVAATAGLVFLAPRLDQAWQGLPALVRRPLAASVAAQLATLPFALATFHQAAPMGVLANLAAVPWCSLLLLAALCWCLLAVVAPPLAAATASILDFAAAPMTWLAATPAWMWQVQPSAAGAAAGWLAAAGLALWLLAPRRRWRLAAVALVGLRCSAAPESAPPRLAMLDVGQGDAILLRGGSRSILVDGGGWSEGDFGGRVLLPALAGEGVRRLDALVLTHADRDHCGGLLDLVDYLEVGELWTAPAVGRGCGRELLLRPGPRLRVLWRGERVALGGWRFETLGPAPGESGSDNGRSLVLRASAADVRVLLTGDIDAAAERRLLRQGAELRADLLKVAHHGSGGSTTDELVAAVAPRLALVSAGAGNPFGHPSPAAIGRLARRHVPVLRTDVAGQVAVAFPGGRRLAVETPAAPR